MNSNSGHEFYIVDYEWTKQSGLFVKVGGFDAEKGMNFEGIIKFLGGKPYGDVVHAQKSSLSASCREKLYAYLLIKYQQNEFS